MNPAKMAFDPKRHTLFTPRNPNKYVGEYPIVAKSSWETTFCQWCDSNPGIIAWASEGVPIPYWDPVKAKNRRYYCDFIIKTVGKDLKEHTTMVEIKPFKEVYPPKPSSGKSSKTQLYEAQTYATNNAKWKAAYQFCKLRGWIFKIITERELYKGGSR